MIKYLIEPFILLHIMDLFQANEVLLSFFPIVLNRIILEYAMPIQHKFEYENTIKNTLRIYDRYYVDGDCMYVYEKGALRVEKCDTCYTIYSHHSMCVYDNHIYVIDKLQINVFNKKCEKIKIIQNYCSRNHHHYCSIIKIAKDKIILSKKQYSNVFIADMNGKIVKQISLNGICWKNKERLYCMNIYDENIYILTYNENICVYSSEGNYIKKYNFKKINKNICIGNFYVIDTILYVHSKHSCGTIYEIINNNIMINKYNTKHDIYSLDYWYSCYKNGRLYWGTNTNIAIYQITQINNLSKLKG